MNLHLFCLNFSNLFSIVSYPKCNFSPLYFAQNAFFFYCFLPNRFLYVFCRNLYAFLHCILPKMQFFSPLYFAHNMFFFVCILPKPLRFSPLYFAQNAFFLYSILPNMFFLYVFCRNLYAFLHCILPKMPSFSIAF